MQSTLAKQAYPTFLDMRSVVVPTDGSQASLEAVRLACSLARSTKGEVMVVHVIEVPRALPLDAEIEGRVQRGEEILTAAEAVAASSDYRIDAELLQAREAGHAVVDEALERNASMIILGIDYHAPYGEFQLGRTTQYILKNARCLVWVCRQPVTGGGD